MPAHEAPCIELGSGPQTPSVAVSPSPSEISSASSPEPQNVQATPLFRALAMPPPDPVQPPGQDELERRLPGYRRIVIPRELTLIELLKQCSGASTDEEVLRIREAKLRVVAERVGLRRLQVLTPRLKVLTLDGSALSSLRDLGVGLVRLKILSVNRCGLTSLDGVWGLGNLRELYASGNKLQDLQPIAALQKLHTLDLSENPIPESSRLWTLGICSSLRKLALSGTPAASCPMYRTRVASALPMLLYLDECPLHTDIDYELDYDSSGSDSDVEIEETTTAPDTPVAHCDPGPSSQFPELPIRRQRPATTECVGMRPTRPSLPPRPKTAQERPSVDAPTRLQIMNTLMDEEWRCSGSRLTSCEPVCGNLARSLRRSCTRRSSELEVDKDLMEQTISDATRSLAAEIPLAPRLEDWVKFKESTGIDIDIDFTKISTNADSSAVLDRLEHIEKETSERLEKENQRSEDPSSSSANASNSYMSFVSDFDLWRGVQDLPPIVDIAADVDSLFNNMSFNPTESHRYLHSNRD